MANDLSFCTEHSGRTCCDTNDTTRVKAKIGYAKMKEDVTDYCFLMTVKALCSPCDGDTVSLSFCIVTMDYIGNWQDWRIMLIILWYMVCIMHERLPGSILEPCREPTILQERLSDMFSCRWSDQLVKAVLWVYGFQSAVHGWCVTQWQTLLWWGA
jgi:hypothetical protein